MTTHEARTLRAITFRIASTPHQQVRAVISSASRGLLDCKALLSKTVAKDSSEGVLVHKLKTQIKTFLNANTPEARWAGAVLVKALIELGGYETLSTSAPWVRALLQNLNKPDPPSTKKIVILTLTRIFLLTHGHQSLVRELTTPSLKEFIQIGLSLISSKTSGSLSPSQTRAQYVLRPTVLRSFSALLPLHPTIFRARLSDLQKVLEPLLVLSDSGAVSPETTPAAQKLFARLHLSAAKSNNSSPAASYSRTLATLVSTAHATTSLVCRSIVEDWSPNPSSQAPDLRVPQDVELTSGSQPNTLDLPAWSGIYGGIRRLRSLLSLTSTCVGSLSSDQVSVPIGSLLDLVTRLCSTTVPRSSPQSSGAIKAEMNSIRINDQISQTERDALLAQLPLIHSSAIELISIIYDRSGGACKSLHEAFLDQILWVFEREHFNIDLRLASYNAVARILDASAAGSSKQVTQQCRMLLEICCDDLLPSTSGPKDGKEKPELTADTLASLTKPATEPTLTIKSHLTPLANAASALLITTLKTIPPTSLSHGTRAKLDRTAILIQNKEAMLASVINAQASTESKKAPSSILPFLARAHPTALETEALLRPRMPVVRTGDNGTTTLDDDRIASGDREASEAGVSVSDDASEGRVNGDAANAVLASPAAGPPLHDEKGRTVPSHPAATGSTSDTKKTKAASSSISEQTSSKRRSPPQPSPETEPKRQRLDPTSQAETRTQPLTHAEMDQVLDGPRDPLQTVPHPTVLPSSSSESTLNREAVAVVQTAPGENLPTNAGPRGESGTAGAESRQVAGEEDSDEDFEIPEINMEPDTEDEEDDKDGDEQDDRDA